MKKVLVIDDDVEVLLNWLIDELARRDFIVKRAASLKEALGILQAESGFCAAVLDLMLPLMPEEDNIFEDYYGRKPQGPEDAMRAGICLIPLLEEKKIPILVLTHITSATEIGEEILQEIPEEKVVGVWNKPPEEDFYEKLQRICGQK
mgnify:CR=1 FL=1